ncbi:3-oxoacyl-[acyl-carrier protein] reductase [Halarchaeum acidiphilum MH1-52-1]|uniref:3-oxoacyl-[acyl-carrier protein] reductase n=1 Tax=Halarchaeum acidiphilum MH1-52-1 TaxID=1261545 RepID=U2YGL9_9EURY|nr:3-oxoacyl-ACP reductase family protein [Halarchaeum acidiphilum]GAD53456.1 3-oxoacyl-[acyl-carrier protein] reductase [Halarchaeum acidiphilum MH1-52-1]
MRGHTNGGVAGSGADPLAGRTALVTGGSRGIGRAICEALAVAGADVAVNYHERADAAAETVVAVEEAGCRATAVRADVSERDACAELIASVEDDLGEIDVLVNNAGIGRTLAPAEVTREEWDDHLATNLTAAFDLTDAVLPGMRERGWGRIVNVTSVAARNGGIVGPHYAASKAGLIGLTRGYANQLAGDGVTVNALAPGLVETDMVAATTAEPEDVPVGRFGRPEEAAAVVALFATNGYLNGQTVNVDGGIRFD